MAARARGSIAAIVAASLLLQVQLMLRRALGAGQGSRLGEAAVGGWCSASAAASIGMLAYPW